MKFHRIELDNWRPFKGHSWMDISSTDERPITLVFGKNGGGKTSMLTAIYWCLYGRMDLEEGKGDQNLVNDYAVQGSRATRKSPAYATVTLYASRPIDDADMLYRIHRRQRAFNGGGSRVEAMDGLIVDRITPHAGYRSGDDVTLACDHIDSSCEQFEDGSAQAIIERLLPQGLAKYFFYPGETLSFPFRNDKKSVGQLRGFLREISGGSKFEPFRDLIDESKRSLDAQSKAHAEASRRTKRLQKDIDELQATLQENKLALSQVEAERDAAEENRNRVVAQLDEIELLQDVLAAAERARGEEGRAQVDVTTAEQALTDALSEAYLTVATDVFEAVVDVFSDRKYPNDVSSSLVKQLRESMECICGRPLTVDMLQLLEPLAPASDSVVARMHTLNSYATSLRTTEEDRLAVDRAAVKLRVALRAKKTAIETRADAEAKLIEAGADEFDEVDRTDLVALRRQLDDEIPTLTYRVGKLQQAIEDGQAAIEDKEAEKRSKAPKDHRDVHRAAAIARQISELLEAIADKQADVAREQLETLINEKYVVYKENIDVAVDGDLFVKVIDRTDTDDIEKSVGDLSGAETALLTYAFAAAAAKLLPQYQTLDKLLTTTPVFAEVQNIPLVVDAPFSNLGHEYKRRVMDLMAKGFSQVIMFTESADTEVLQDSLEMIGAEYLVHFEGDLAEGVERSFEWRGLPRTYASPGGATRSTIESIG